MKSRKSRQSRKNKVTASLNNYDYTASGLHDAIVKGIERFEALETDKQKSNIEFLKFMA